MGLPVAQGPGTEPYQYQAAIWRLGLPLHHRLGGTIMSIQVGHDPGNFYVWRASDGFAIHLSLNMVTQLTAQIARTAGNNQSEETRGILLGRSIETPCRATVID